MDYDCEPVLGVSFTLTGLSVGIDQDQEPAVYMVEVRAESTALGNGRPPARFWAVDEDYCTAYTAAATAASAYFSAP